MRRCRLIEIVCVAITVAAVAVVFLVMRGLGPAVDSRLHSGIGRVLAEEALGLLPEGGEIVVFTRDTEEFAQPALDILLRRFQREVGRKRNVSVTVKTVPVDPLRPVTVPSGDLLSAIRRSDRDKVIVSLLGPPVLTAAEFRILAAVRPKIIAFCPGVLPSAVNLDGLLDSGMLRAAVIDRPMAPGGERPRPGASGGFDRLYTVLRSGSGAAGTPRS